VGTDARSARKRRSLDSQEGGEELEDRSYLEVDSVGQHMAQGSMTPGCRAREIER
jgi:hypothetical protein